MPPDNSPPDDGIHSSSPAGVAGHHPVVDPFSLFVAPATAAEQRNLINARLIPVGCWRVDDIRFQFQSSFVLPDSRDEFVLLSDLIDEHTESGPAGKLPPPLSIFGHADPVGDDEYNKLLSGRRAAAVYGMLTRRDEIWEDLYSNQGQFAAPVPGDEWGAPALQTMQSEVGGGSMPRRQLFLAYMDAVCVRRDGTPLRIDPVQGFLARKADAQGKGDFQGCGEFNPLLIFSDAEQNGFSKPENKSLRNAANAPNRRVLALLFRPGSLVASAKWPCPKAKEGSAGCRKRFWSDGESRRSRRLPDAERKYEETKDTFACRFYSRLVGSSPCEGVLPVWSIRLFDAFAKPMGNVPYQLTMNGGVRRNKTDGQGWVHERGVEVPARIRVNWGVDDAYPDFSISRYEMYVQADLDQVEEQGDDPDTWRFHNLGYGADCEFTEAVGHFQQDYGLPPTGIVDPATQTILRDAHDSAQPQVKQKTSPSSTSSESLV